MATIAQTLANQVNARSSTGPRTPEGKAAASRNATRHGLAAAFAVLPHEDPSLYQQLLDAYAREFRPVTEHESFLIEQMAQARFRIQRIQRLEGAVFDRMLLAGSPSETPDARIADRLLQNEANPLTSLQRYLTAAERAYYKAHSTLTKTREQQRRLESSSAAIPQNEANLARARHRLELRRDRYAGLQTAGRFQAPSTLPEAVPEPVPEAVLAPAPGCA